MKKTLSLILALLMLFSLAACGGGGKVTPDEPQKNDVTEEAKLNETAIVEEIEGVGPVKLSNSYLEVTIPEGIGYYVDDANTAEGDSQFQLILELRNSNGDEIGELLFNNRGGFDNVTAYSDSLKEEYKDSTSVTVADVESKKIGLFDVNHLTVDRGFMVDNRYIGYYLIPDETAEYRNVRLDLELRGYYYQDTPYPAAECEAIISSIVIK